MGKSSAKPACFFCDATTKRTTFEIWTARVGDMVEVHAGHHSIAHADSYHNLVGYEVTVCNACARTYLRRHRLWLLLTALGTLAVMLLVAVIALAVIPLKGNPNAVWSLMVALGFSGVMLIVSMAAMGTFFFGKRTYAAVEAAIAAQAYREINPDATAGLSSAAFNALQPPQIKGSTQGRKGGAPMRVRP